jgi:diguanylate cyclase (GGDEF)-like protein
MGKGTILIVDDDPLNVDLLKRILTKQGYDVRSATNGRETLASSRENPSDLVLLDIRMEEMDGYEVCRRLKADPVTASIPVIFVSAMEGGMDKARAFAVGGVDYVTKPFHAAEVVARIEVQLKISRLQQQMVRKNAELERTQQEIVEKNEELEQTKEELVRKNEELERKNQILQALSYLDPLTGIPNRRHLDETLKQEWRRARRVRQPLSLVIADVDHFKIYNDTYGHQTGDECLKAVAAQLKSAERRAGDLAARYGGEEFALVLPGTDEKGAWSIAEDVRTRVEGLGMLHSGSSHRVVTVSCGAATAYPAEDDTPEDLILAADRALYRAKESGRNRSAAAPDSQPSSSRESVAS